MSSSRFEGKTAIVTGAGSGLGREIAVRLSEEGASVTLVGRRLDALEETAKEIENSGGTALAVSADVAQRAEVEAAIGTSVNRFGRLDLLVNAAGVLKLGDVTNSSEKDWDLQFDVNAKGCFLTSRAAIPIMRSAGKGAIVNVSSVFAFGGSKGATIYSASKAAVVALTRGMAIDHIHEGIRINGIAPGSMDTPMLNEVASRISPEAPDVIVGATASLNPTGRLATVGEIALLALYLLSDDAASIVGVTYPIDGGRLAMLGAATPG